MRWTTICCGAEDDHQRRAAEQNGNLRPHAAALQEARKNFNRAVKTDRNHADAYNNLAWLLRGARLWKAIKNYEKAAALNPGAPPIQQSGCGLLRKEAV